MQQIKYDIKDKKIFRICAIVCTLFFVATFVFSCTSMAEEMDSVFFAYIMIMGTTMFPVLALAFWVFFFDSITYLGRLKKYGYEIPNNKKDYDKKLEALKIEELKSFEEPNKESTILSVSSFVVSVGMFINSIAFFVRFSAILENISFVGILIVLMAVLWFIIGIVFWKQRNRGIYKDDVEPAATIKVRKHIVEGLVIIFILLFLSCVGSSVIYNMAEYVEKSIEMNATE